MDEGASAIDVFSIELIRPPRWRFWAAMLFNLAGQYMASDSGGGNRAIFRRRSSDEVVGEFTQSFIGESASEYTIVLSDYSTMSAHDFEQTWLVPQDRPGPSPQP